MFGRKHRSRKCKLEALKRLDKPVECAACENAWRSLNTFPVGTKVRIEELCDCPRMRGRMYSLGLTPGTEVEIASSGPGACRLNVRGCNLALGHRMAGSILCSAVNGAGPRKPLQ